VPFVYLFVIGLLITSLGKFWANKYFSPKLKMIEHQFSIDIVLDRRYKKTSGLFPVKLWVYSTATQKSKRYPTRFSFSVKEFDSIWNTSKPRKEYQETRQELDALKSRAVMEAKALSVFSFDLFEKKLMRQSGEGDNVFHHYQQAIRELTNNDQLGSASSYYLSMKSIKAFIEHETQKTPEYLSFSTITPTWLNQYEKFMVQTKGNSLTTVSIYGRALRAVFNRAIKDNDIHSRCISIR
jgi:hypothetical protein